MMDYTDESYERFQDRLLECIRQDSLLWKLRDSLFGEAFYGKRRKIDLFNRLPGGWLLSLCVQYLQAFHASRRNQIPDVNSGTRHFLFLSTRNNHIQRLAPLWRRQRDRSRCHAWYIMEGVPETLHAEERSQVSRIVGQWSRYLKPADLIEASRLVDTLRRIFPTELTRIQCSKLRIYLVQFLAWRRFWHSTLGEGPTEIVTTFEKPPHAKAFFFAGWEKNCPSRIHWVHGLRHASIQSTLSTELWCMTPGDVRYFRRRVPNFCQASVKKNPEAELLVQQVGRMDPKDFAGLPRLHVLFLGPGLEASYPREMRMADLAVIRRGQAELGDRIAWRFRPHPSAVERFRSELKQAGIRIDEFSTAPLHVDLGWCHVVASAWSSLLLDVRETGRPIFWVQAEVRPLGGVDELISDGIGIHVDESTIATQLVGLLSG